MKIIKAKISREKEISFLTGSIPKSLISFSIPFILSILVQNLYGAVDLLVVGNFATTSDVSAVTIGSQLMTLVTQLIIGFATGITVLVGQYYGAKDKKGISRTIGTSVILFSFIAIILMAIYLGFHKHLISLMKTPFEAIGETEEYLFVCALGIVFIAGYNVISSILTAMGDSKTPFIFVLIACLINVVLDILFVKKFHMGALGAAIATTIAQAGSFFFALIFLKRNGIGVSITREDFHFDKKEIINIVLIGGPVALQNMLVNASFLFITTIINQMGVVASAAVGVVEKLITFIFVPATAMGTAVGAASAQNIGANQLERAKKTMWWGILIALIPAIIFTLLCQFFGSSLAGIMTKDPEVIEMSADYLRSYVFDVLMVSFVFSMNGFFNSFGKSWFSLIHSLLTTFAVRIPLAYFISTIDGSTLFELGWASPLSTFVSLILCLIFLSKIKPQKSMYTADATTSEIRESPGNFVITIAREYGSGGRLIGESIAKKLGISFYNRNLIDLTAKRSGLAENYITHQEEYISSRFIWTSPTGGRNVGSPAFSNYYSNIDTMFNTQSQIIREIAEKEACVIVGRCADYVLRDHPNCINVFIYANLENRKKQLVQKYGVDIKKAEETALNTDRGRANYYRFYTGKKWGDREQYQLMIDSGMLGIEDTAELIVQSVRKLYPSIQ
ncbi:MATE family efflux transporter [Anaerosphaera multitolerans]|uniref:MATE family efflux transporter n=1 Tax=Anaerosphaera multitolerans TaxID=2487351 RepID=A0A437S5N3_9FIRM|nr:MATE family efflux transporter [Anaerosphaera multitolerans]RVU54304.1 MATE family efflux transporter [Anaerosphaera multitolerans]